MYMCGEAQEDIKNDLSFFHLILWGRVSHSNPALLAFLLQIIFLPSETRLTNRIIRPIWHLRDSKELNCLCGQWFNHWVISPGLALSFKKKTDKSSFLFTRTWSLGWKVRYVLRLPLHQALRYSLLGLWFKNKKIEPLTALRQEHSTAGDRGRGLREVLEKAWQIILFCGSNTEGRWHSVRR